MPVLKKPALLISAAIVLAAGTALANPKADTNLDGQITQAEFIAAATTRFVTDDTNADGVLTEEERMAGRKARKEIRASERFAKSDTNADGFISEDEYKASRAERDAKRQASKSERKEKRALKRAERAEKRQKGDGPCGKRRINPDANDDGVISKAEHDAATLAMFERLDANGDGVLTEGEGRKRKGGKRGRKGHAGGGQ